MSYVPSEILLKGVYNQKYNEKYCGFVSGIK
jgi:hypothetical protein